MAEEMVRLKVAMTVIDKLIEEHKNEVEKLTGKLERLEAILDRILTDDGSPVYYSHDSRDCDGMHVVTAGIAENYTEFMKMKMADMAGAEGPTFIHEITKEEHEFFEPIQRDLFAEAAGY